MEARASRLVIGAFGAVVAMAGLEHGIGEMLQGPIATPGILIESWPNAAAFEVLSGEPAMTLFPNLFLAGVATVVAALVFATWAVRFVVRRHGGLVLIGLAVLLLLVGGGLAPPLIGVILGLAAVRMTAASRTPGAVARALAPLWRWALGVGVICYLGLFPGMVLASAVLGIEEEGLVIGLASGAFASLLIALAGARASDRLAASRATAGAA